MLSSVAPSLRSGCPEQQASLQTSISTLPTGTPAEGSDGTGTAADSTTTAGGSAGWQKQLVQGSGVPTNVQVLQLKGALRVTTVDNFQVGHADCRMRESSGQPETCQLIVVACEQ